MIALILCDCGGAELMGRRKLLGAGMKDYLEPVAYKGKEAGLRFLDNFPKNDKEVILAKEHLKNFSSYAIVFGYKEGKIRWTDVADGSPISALDVGVIVDNYA